MIPSDTTSKLLIAIGIIVVGFILARFSTALIVAAAKRKDVISVKQMQVVRLIRYSVLIFTLIAALIFLRVDFTRDVTVINSFLSNTYNLLPTILLVILIIVLAIVIVNLIAFSLKRIFDASGITEFMVEQKRVHFLNGILFLVRVSLYIFTALFLLNLFGINIQGITQTIGWFFLCSWSTFFFYISFLEQRLLWKIL